jgi:GNAT superfamily N-acetyltransferase
MGLFTLHDVWLRKIRRTFQDHGLGSVLRKGIAYLIRPLYENRTYRLYRIDLAGTQTEDPSLMEGVEFRFLSSEQTQDIREIEQLSEWLHGSLAKRIEVGALCLAAFEDGKVAGFNLISFGAVYMPLVRLHHRFRRDEAWSEQITVAKDSREKGLGANLRYRIFQELRNRGYRTLYGGALLDNIPSLKLAQRVGFREFVDIHYVRVLASNKWQYRRLGK